MSLYTRIRDYFNPPKLRNKPGGMAWIKGLNDVTGEHVLNGHAVKTVALDKHGLWTLEPPQIYVATASATYPFSGARVEQGHRARLVSAQDCYLEPWKEIGDDARDESLRYLPPVPSIHRVPTTKEPA